MSLLERAIEALSPEWATKRAVERARLELARRVVNSGYSHHGASRNKTSTVSWNSGSKSPSEDITENLELPRERSRDLYARGAPMGRGAIERVVLNSVGPGLTLPCRVAADSLGMTEEAAAEWEPNSWVATPAPSGVIKAGWWRV